MAKLLLIDDDLDVLKINKNFLTRQGYEVMVSNNAVSSIQSLNKYHPDCIILDIMMPELDGFKSSQKIRSITDTPFIFLTGVTSEAARLKGFQLGADDYITKPYSLKELSARINVVLRRSNKQVQSASEISYPPLRLDLTLHKAFYDTEEIALSNREYELLYHLMTKPNQTLTFEKLGQLIWGSYTSSDRRTIMVTASRLRKKLSYYEGLDELITTVWSEGYQFHKKKVK
ncbi:MAG: response regulator transcription factor [bacterium]|nr:response regulator transcription factor [bacterium]